MISVSVIIPLYNVEQFISRCLQSLIIQTFKSFEVIIVNDASTDSSVNIAESFKDKFDSFSIIHHNRNKGLMYARYSGYRIAIGQYFVFLDSDDFLPENGLEVLYNAIVHSNVDMVKSGFSTINEKDDVIGCYRPIQPIHVSGAHLREDILTDKIMHNVWGAIYSRILFNGVAYDTFENQTNSEDLLLMLQLCDNIKEYRVISDSTYFYYENSASSSRRRFSEKKLRQYLNALAYVYNKSNLEQTLRYTYVSKYIGALLYNNYDINIIQEYFPKPVSSLFSVQQLWQLHGGPYGIVLSLLFRSRSLRILIYKMRPIINFIRHNGYNRVYKISPKMFGTTLSSAFFFL